MVTAAHDVAGAEVVAAGRVVTPDGVLEPGWVEVVGDRIVSVGRGSPPVRASVARPSATLVPGFVDVHVHGGGGAAYTDGDPDAAARAARAHLQHGTTTTVASLVTAALGDLERSVAALADLVADGVLAGVHLEGPWLSARQRGAHDPALLRVPDAADVERLLAAGRGTVRMVTLAPELDGGLDAVSQVVAHGAVAAVGHTDATYDVTRAALDAGATVGTHLFNAMRPVHHRDPGPALALLEDPRARVELVADGVHLHPAVLRHAAASAGRDRCLLVTDAMAAAAAADGDYRLGRLGVRVRDGQARLASTGAIAGSTLTMDAAVRHAVHVVGVPLLDAVHAAATVPAAVLGLDDVGALAPGRRADLVLLDRDLRVDAVMRAGTWVRRPSSAG